MSTRNVIHIDIPSRSYEESGKFYHDLFGWKITPIPQLKYAVWESGVGSRGGFPPIGGEEFVKVGEVHIYVESDDIDADLEKAKSLGAKILSGKKEIAGNRGWIGLFIDPTGNTIGLWKK